MGFSLKKVLGGGLTALANPTIAGGLMGIAGDVYSARKLAAGQQQANEFGIASAREQMAFQRDMSNTAHQREVNDLRLAGINPLLSANAGASTPVGSAATAENAAPDYSRAASSALSMAMAAKDLRLADAQIGKLRAEKDSIETGTRAKNPYADIGDILSQGINSAKNVFKLQGTIDRQNKRYITREQARKMERKRLGDGKWKDLHLNLK